MSGEYLLYGMVKIQCLSKCTRISTEACSILQVCEELPAKHAVQFNMRAASCWDQEAFIDAFNVKA